MSIFTKSISLGMLGVFGFAGLAFAGPKITSPEPVYNFGERPNTDVVAHDFIIRNDGDAPLEISDVKTSCGCTVAKPAKNSLAPGEETIVSATLKLSGEGHRTKDITVFSNDPANPSFNLSYAGTALAAIKYEPTTLDFGQINDDAPHELKMKIMAGLEGVTFNIVNLNLNVEYLSASYETLEAGKSYEVTVKTSGEVPSGRIAGMLTVETDSDSLKEIRVYVTGQVMGDFFIQPESLRLRYEETPGKTMNGFLRISPGKITEFKILEVVKPIESMDVQFEQQGPAYLIRLQNLPVDDTLNGKSLIVKTDVAGHEEIKIPILVMKPQPEPAPVVAPVAVPAPAPAPAVAPAAAN